jgi:hypothetical protein
MALRLVTFVAPDDSWLLKGCALPAGRAPKRLNLLAYLDNACQEKQRVQRGQLMGDSEAIAALRSQSLDGAGRHVAVQIQLGEFRDYCFFLIGEKGQFWKMRKNVGVAIAT